MRWIKQAEAMQLYCLPGTLQGAPNRFADERRARENRLDARMLTVADIQVLIAAALAEERGAVVPALRGAIDELLDRGREHAKSELVERARRLELQVAKLEAAVSGLGH